MKSRLLSLSILLVIIMFSASQLKAGELITKWITFQYITNSDGMSYPAEGDCVYEYWTTGDMSESSHGTGPVSEVVVPGSGLSVTFNIGASPVWWYYGMGYNTVHLKVTNENLMIPQSNTFTGALDQDENHQTFEDDYSLPVELISFTVRTEDQVVILEWETASEVDNVGFNVYKSLDYKEDYQPVNSALIPGAGNTSESHNYIYKDVDVLSGETYYYKLESVNINGNTISLGPVAIAVGDSELDLPEDYALSQNYPNPFNPVTTIQYNLPEVSSVKLCVFDIRGRLVNQLVNANQDAGIYVVQWSGFRNTGEAYPSGVYFYELRTESYREIR